MEGLACRTCLSITEEEATVNVEQKCYSNQTVKDILIQFLPPLESTLSDSDRICRICFKTIKCFMRFLDKCLDVEKNLAKKHELAELGGNIEIVENIQIVVEDDLHDYFSKAETKSNLDDSSENIEHDHAYIKSECEETEEKPNRPFALEADDPFVQVAESDESYLKGDAYESADQDENTDQDEKVAYSQSNSSQVPTEGTESEANDMHYIKAEEMDTNDSIILAAGDVDFFEQLETENIYICEQCGEGFLSELLLKEHMVLHGRRSIICDKCPKVFRNNVALRAHYKLKHLEAERYKCDICEQSFARADYLRNHLKRHEEDRDSSKVKCRVPGKFLRFKNTDDPLPCKICGKYYNGIQKLKVHLQTHLIVKRYKCEFCDLTYKRWPSLKRHEKTHLESNQQFHRCNVCWKRFNTEVELEGHMTQHGNPRYRCQICEEYFHRKYLFDNHYLLKHATEEDIENSKKEIIYDTLLELSSQTALLE